MLNRVAGKIKHQLYHSKMIILVVCYLTCGFKYTQTNDYSLQANIIYRFTKYMDWPSTVKSGDFVIGVVGDISLIEDLKFITKGKKVGSQNILVKAVKNVESSLDCHILFIAEDESNFLKKNAPLLDGKPILIITEKEGYALKGACVNFVTENEHIQLEFNKKNFESRHLKVAAELMGLGIIVD